MGALSLGNLLLGSAAAPAMSAIASAYAGMGVDSRIPWSALEYSGTDITAISGSAIGGNIDTSDFVHTADMSGYATTGDLDDKLDKTATGDFITSTAGLQPAGDYAFNSSLTSKLDTSAFSSVSGTFLTAVPADYATTAYVDSSVSGKADATALTAYQPAGDYAYNSSLSSKLDTSAFSSVSGTFLTAVPEGYATEAYVDSSVSGKQDTLTFGYSGSYISSINGSSIIDSTAGGVDSATVSAIASSYASSAASSKLDKTAQVVTSIGMGINPNMLAYINGHPISAALAYQAESAASAGSASYARSSQTARSAVYDTLGRPLSSLGTGGGADYTSEYGTVYISGTELEGTNSAVDMHTVVTPAINVTGSSNRSSTPVITNLTAQEFYEGNLTGSIKPGMTGTYSVYLGYADGTTSAPLWSTSWTNWQPTSYTVDLQIPSAYEDHVVSSVYVGGPGEYTYTATGFRLSSEEAVVTESAVRELAWKDDCLAPSASSTFYPMSGNPSGFLRTSDTANFFHTSLLDSSSVSGHDTEFNIVFEPTQHSVEVSAIESAQLDTDTSRPDHFLPLNDYNADWFWTAGTGIIFPGQRLTAYASGVVTSHTEDRITARALTAYSHGAPVSGTSTGAAFMLGGIEMIPAYTNLGDGRSSFTAGTTADMTAITTDWTGTGDYSGTAVFAMSRYFFAPGFEQVSGWFKLDGSAGSATITQNDVCRVPGDAGDASTPIFISGGSSLPCTGLNWLSALSAWATAQGWTP